MPIQGETMEIVRRRLSYREGRRPLSRRTSWCAWMLPSTAFSGMGISNGPVLSRSSLNFLVVIVTLDDHRAHSYLSILIPALLSAENIIHLYL